VIISCTRCLRRAHGFWLCAHPAGNQKGKRDLDRLNKEICSWGRTVKELKTDPHKLRKSPVTSLAAKPAEVIIKIPRSQQLPQEFFREALTRRFFHVVRAAKAQHRQENHNQPRRGLQRAALPFWQDRKSSINNSCAPVDQQRCFSEFG